MRRTRTIQEGVLRQGVDEQIAYTLDVSPVGDAPTGIVVEVFDASDLSTAINAEVMPAGAPSVAGNVITLPPLRSLTAGRQYRIEVRYTIDGNILETYFSVIGER